MNQQEVFAGAQWVAAGRYTAFSTRQADPDGLPNFPILRAGFEAADVTAATLRVIGLGFFHCYLNGQEVTEDQFLPLSTDYEPRPNSPVGEVVTGHRMYVPTFDVTNLVREGNNTLAVWFGGGWYTFWLENFGSPKVIYRLTLTHSDGSTTDICSSEHDRIGDSCVKTTDFTTFEARDDRGFDFACLGADFDDSAWPHAVPAKSPDTTYCYTDCPADRTERECPVTAVRRDGQTVTYDCGINTSGYPVLTVNAPAGAQITVRFSEELCPDGSLDPRYHFGQSYYYISDGQGRTVTPLFTWFAFRYFTVEGDAVPTCVRVVRSHVPVTATFDCDSETVNWFYHAYINTQKNNMHAGIPSDCPHIERRGYTGDGELTCHAAMSVLDAEAFYRKWVWDIADCQDTLTGHVQYTAPYIHSGGGPGAWGCAIVEVPYMIWQHYGDTVPMTHMYGQMKRYFDYLEAHSHNGLVVSDKPGDWCLGDWCAPEAVALPAPFVNNYYYIKSLMRAREIAAHIGHEADIPAFDETIAVRKQAIMDAYFNTWDGNFIGGLQGANAFALDIGLGDERTYANLVNHYRRIGHFDTGICGTDLVTRELFERGDGELAVSLLDSRHPVSFEGMRQAGATTIWENWPQAVWERSHDHPMFGSPAAYLFDFLLGMRQQAGTVGYSSLVIKPCFVRQLNRVSGSRTLPAGEVSVSYRRADDGIHARITLPVGLPAQFVHGDTVIDLVPGVNEFIVTE